MSNRTVFVSCTEAIVGNCVIWHQWPRAWLATLARADWVKELPTQ